MDRTNPLKELVGLRLWRTRHLADARGLDFGGRRASVTRRGEPCVVADYVIHIQCPWRVVAGDGQIIEGVHVPSDSATATVVLAEFLGEHGLLVVDASYDVSGTFRLSLEDGAFVEVAPNGDEDDEVWRFFRPLSDGHHFVQFINRSELD